MGKILNALDKVTEQVEKSAKNIDETAEKVANKVNDAADKAKEIANSIAMRPLIGRDMRLVSLIASKLDLDVKKIINTFMEVRAKMSALEGIKDEALKEAKTLLLLGDFAEIMFKNVVEKLHNGYDEVNALLSAITGLPIKELEQLEFDIYINLVKRLISNKSFMQLFRS